MIANSTLNFLKELSENNSREWFQVNKDRYEEAREDILKFTSDLIKSLAKVDPTIPAELDAKNCVMRIYRDIRFSKDKTPFKTNFGIAISGNGKSFNGPGYYVHVQPGKSFIAGGAWFPEAEKLKAIRQEIDYNSSDLHDIIDDPEFKEMFGTPDAEGKLKTVPKGYSADHPDIDLLKLKSFTFTRAVSEKDMVKSGFVAEISHSFEKLYPFMVFLRNAIA